MMHLIYQHTVYIQMKKINFKEIQKTATKRNSSQGKDLFSESSTANKKSLQLTFQTAVSKLREKKRNLQNEESAAKEQIKLITQRIREEVTSRQIELLRQVDDNILKILQAIDKMSSFNSTEFEIYQTDVLDLINFKLEVVCDDVKDDLERMFSLKDYSSYLIEETKTSAKSKISVLKYQEMVDKLQNKLETVTLNEQRLIQTMKELETKLKKGQSHQPKHKPQIETVFQERFKNQNEILIQQNLISSQKVLELLSENSMLRQNLRVSQQNCTQLQEQVKRAANNIERLQSKLNMPDKKVLEENRNLQNTIKQKELIIDNINMKLQEHKQKISVLEENIHKYRFEINKCDSEIEYLNQSLEQYSKTLEEGTRKYRLMQESYLQISRQKDKLYDITQQRYSAIERLKEENAQLKEQTEKQKEINHHLQQSIENQRMLSTHLAERLKTTENQNQEAAKQFKQGVATWLSEKQNLLNQINQLQEEVQQLRNQNTNNKQAQFYQRQLNQALTQIKFLRDEVGKAQADNRNLTQINEHLEIQLQNKVVKNENSQKESYLKKKQQLTSKLHQQKIFLQQSYNTKVEILKSQMLNIRHQIFNLKQLYESRRKLAQFKTKIIKERFAIDIIMVFEKNRVKVTKFEEIIQIAERMVQSFSNLCHKQSIITKMKEQKGQLAKQVQQLKNKLREIEDKKVKKIDKKHTDLKVEAQIKQLSLQVQIQRLKGERGITEEKLRICQEKNLKSETVIKKLEFQKEEVEKINQVLIQEIKQHEKKKRSDKIEEEDIMESVRNKQVYIQEQNEQLRNQIQRLNKVLDEVRLEKDNFQKQIKIKKDHLNNVKKQNKDLQQLNHKYKKSLEEEVEQHQKSKKMIKQWQRKQALYRDNKQKFQQLKNSEKQLSNLKKTLEEKTKQFKLQLSKKDSIIKLLKQKQNSELKQIRESKMDITVNEVQVQNQVKKLKSQIERKDSHIKVLNQKIEKYEETIDKQKKQNQKRMQRQKLEFDKESKKVEQLRLQNKKLESEHFMFKSLIKKIYRNIPTKKEELHMTTNRLELSKFSEGLSILNLNANDLKLFLPEAKQNTSTENMENVRKFQQLLQDSRQINVSVVYQKLMKAMHECLRI